jgi:hypothetical protein
MGSLCTGNGLVLGALGVEPVTRAAQLVMFDLPSYG